MEPKTCPHKTCGHTWTPRKAEPKKCPQCQNPLWTSPRPKKQKPHKSFIDIVRDQVETTSLEPGVEIFNVSSDYMEDPKPVKDSLSEAKARAEELIRQLA